ncbi:response regulator transcription factor [Streptomyces kaniharaensis]|uniref:Response regulator transcription factor n=1 Tax=Streptomyces kaniharaensis TaxID=212423 RepID=A0A6N7KKF9_9ACTN|nr:response regulator transcription factor [Streptomyces kaniharaensis]MQS11255.1 response regulator transcription factor [Streptomyces kaniharaensis]
MSPVNTRPTVLVVEGNVLLRTGLRALLSAESDLALHAAVGDVDQALEVLAGQRVDVVVYGAGESAADTERALGRLLDRGARVVVLSRQERPGEMEMYLNSGVSAYLTEDAAGECLCPVIRGLTADRERVYIMASRSGLGWMAGQRGGQLSGREREVMGLVANGLSNSDIAGRLCISPGTVKRHLRNVFVKLNAVSRIDAVNKARAAAMLVPAGHRA